MKKISNLFKRKKDEEETSEDKKEVVEEKKEEVVVPKEYVDTTLAHCVVCAKKENLNRCKACKIAKYCCVDHQRQNWPEHKKACGSLKIYFENEALKYEKGEEVKQMMINEIDIRKEESVLKEWSDYFFGFRKSHFDPVFRTLKNIPDDQPIDTTGWEQISQMKYFTRILTYPTTLYFSMQQLKIFDIFADKDVVKQRLKKKHRVNIHILMDSWNDTYENFCKNLNEFNNFAKTKLKKVGVNIDFFLNQYSDQLKTDDTAMLPRFNTFMQMIKLEYRYVQLAEKYEKPDILLYLNSSLGINNENKEEWLKRVSNLVELNVPVIVTMPNQKEFEKQKEIIFGELKASPLDLGLSDNHLNPFRELVSSPNPANINDLDAFNSANKYIIAFQGM